MYTNKDTKEDTKPLLIYDGDCGFCSYWVEYWKNLTQNTLDYKPYQEIKKHHPNISEEEFQNSIQYIDKDGTWQGDGAKAAFLTLNHDPERKFWLTLYQKLSFFAALAEWAYRFIAKRRNFFYGLCRALWGKTLEPPSFNLLSWIFLRILGLIFLSAFLSFAVQSMALIGSQGVLPLNAWTGAMETRLGESRYWHVPTLFWLNDSNLAIHMVCWIGVLSSLLLTTGVLPRTNLILLYILYLSLVYGGQRFMSFQWDLLLIEVGFLAILLTIWQRPTIWLLRFLTFRFMFASGLVKIASGDITWKNLTALNYHFETQPLPTPLAWHAHHLPEAFLRFGTGATLVIELLVPFLIFLPRHFRFIAAASFLVLQISILLTGNYNFFNILAILLCLTLLDDQALRCFIPKMQLAKIQSKAIAKEPSKIVQSLVYIAAFWTLTASIIQFNNRFFGRDNLPSSFQWVNQSIAPLQLVNTYGPFAVMTRRRPEIIIEGSSDGKTWKEYDFIYKAGDITRGMSFNIPHQPRIDWQLWFAAMDNPRNNPWFTRLLARILEGEKTINSLFRHNPFPDSPPRYVRTTLYDYSFANPQERNELGIYWKRQKLQTYFPTVSK